MDDNFRFLTFVIFTVALVLQLLAICYLGNQLSAESDGITHVIYLAQWMDHNEKYKRVICILVERSMQLMPIYAGNLFEDSLSTFVKVWNAPSAQQTFVSTVNKYSLLDSQVGINIFQCDCHNGRKTKLVSNSSECIVSTILVLFYALYGCTSQYTNHTCVVDRISEISRFAMDIICIFSVIYFLFLGHINTTFITPASEPSHITLLPPPNTPLSGVKKRKSRLEGH